MSHECKFEPLHINGRLNVTVFIPIIVYVDDICVFAAPVMRMNTYATRSSLFLDTEDSKTLYQRYLTVFAFVLVEQHREKRLRGLRRTLRLSPTLPTFPVPKVTYASNIWHKHYNTAGKVPLLGLVTFLLS